MEAFVYRKISLEEVAKESSGLLEKRCPHEYKLISLGKDDEDGRYIPVAIWKCVKCGHIEEDIWDDESKVRMR